MIPNDEELVATGAACQAAAILESTTPAEVADTWNLRTGTTIRPLDPHAESIRHNYRTAAATIGHHFGA